MRRIIRHFRIALGALAALVLIAATPASGLLFSGGGGSSTTQEPVLFALDWAVYGRHAPYFVALDRGYYSSVGLDVSIERGFGSADTIKRVASGQAQFGFADLGALVVARTDPAVRVKAVAVVYAKAPHFLFCNADLGIREPRDLEGHLIGTPADNATRVLFPAFAAVNQIDPDRVPWVDLDAAVQMEALFAERVDCIAEFFDPLLIAQARERDFHYSVIRYADHGMDFYSNALVVQEDLIRTNPELVRRFVRATLSGLQATFASPESSLTILQSYHPEVADRESALEEIALVRDLATTDQNRVPGLGFLLPEKVKASRDLIVDAFGITGAEGPEALYTNQFLEPS